MEIKDKLKLFAVCRPHVIAAYGYGSGVFKQQGYEENDHPQLDLILVVDDIVKFHKENMEQNPNDYSFIGKVFYNISSKETIKGMNGVTYQSHIEELGSTFKYGVVEFDDLEHQLLTWENFYLPGRFQKPILEVIGNRRLSSAIEENRNYALMTALQFMHDGNTLTDLYEKIVSLSYIGDTRMEHFENPNKIKNIVAASFEELDKIYNKKAYFNVEDDKITLNYDAISKEYLPAYLAHHLLGRDRLQGIEEYLTMKNQEESINQTIHGLKTNGIVRSTDYAFEKVKKRIYKK